MTDFAEVWHFTRFRLNQAIDGLTDAQLRWRMNENAHTIAEILFHIAGAEHYWASRLSGNDPGQDEYSAKLDRAVHDGFLKDGMPPFSDHEMTASGARDALDHTFNELREVIENPSSETLEQTLISPVGDEVTGKVGLTRISQHAGYHTGQIWMIRMDPRFPN